MNRFMLLPAGIRHKIWLDCLPVRPTTHFFEVVNHPRNHIWSAEEFRFRATRAYDSGYLAVYALLATCREARLVVAAHYNRVRRTATFETFDWMPTDDLVVLCFPPRQAKLSHMYALTDGASSKVWVCWDRCGINNF